MDYQQVLQFSFPQWAANFKDVLHKHRILPLPQSVVDYLVADGVFVPTSTGAVSFVKYIAGSIRKHGACQQHSQPVRTNCSWKACPQGCYVWYLLGGCLPPAALAATSLLRVAADMAAVLGLATSDE